MAYGEVARSSGFMPDCPGEAAKVQKGREIVFFFFHLQALKLVRMFDIK